MLTSREGMLNLKHTKESYCCGNSWGRRSAVGMMVWCPHTFGHMMFHEARTFDSFALPKSRFSKESFRKNRFARESFTTIVAVLSRAASGQSAQHRAAGFLSPARIRFGILGDGFTQQIWFIICWKTACVFFVIRIPVVKADEHTVRNQTLRVLFYDGFAPVLELDSFSPAPLLHS